MNRVSIQHSQGWNRQSVGRGTVSLETMTRAADEDGVCAAAEIAARQ